MQIWTLPLNNGAVLYLIYLIPSGGIKEKGSVN